MGAVFVAGKRPPGLLSLLTSLNLDVYTHTVVATEMLRNDWGLIDAFKCIQQITENKQSHIQGQVSKAFFPMGKSDR